MCDTVSVLFCVPVERSFFVAVQLTSSRMESSKKSLVFIRISFSDGLAEALHLFSQPVDAYEHLFLVGLEVDVFPPQLDIFFENLLVFARKQVDRTLQLFEKIVVLFAAREDPGENAAEESPGSAKASICIQMLSIVQSVFES